MRKIERDLKAAWDNGSEIHIDNSAVEIIDGVVTLKLFGNTIAEKVNGETRWTLAGWDTATTKSRLRNVVGARIENEHRENKREWFSL